MVTLQGDNMILSVPRNCLQDSDDLLSKEWLVTNGLGGYASGTLLCAPRDDTTACSSRISRLHGGGRL